MKSAATEPLSVKRRKKKKKEQATVYTTTAPLQIISLFYQMEREANEDKKSALTLQLPDDTPIPDPVCSYKLSGLDLTESWCGSPCSIGKNSPYKCNTVENCPMHNLTHLDLGMIDSSSWFIDDDVDELNKDGTPSVFFQNNHLSSNQLHDDSSISADKRSSNSGPTTSIEEKKSRISKRRSNSLDCAFSDGNEAFKVSISDYKSPDPGESLSGEKKEDEDVPFLKWTEDKLNTGLLSTTSSKTHLNSRLKTYDRHKGKLSGISWKKNTFVTGALIRAATSGSLKCSPKPVIEEKQVSQEHWSVRVLPLSFFTSSEMIEPEESKSETRRIHSSMSSGH